ncbi:MAG: hypothetical protein ACTS3F_12625 [Phycisphaerales bacterium]
MSSDATPEARENDKASSTTDDAKRRVLMVMILSKPSVTDDIITALLEFGISATVMQSKGLMALIREEMPIFSGLASLMPEQTGSRVLLSITNNKTAGKVFEFLEDDLPQADRPIAFTVPIERHAGLPAR